MISPGLDRAVRAEEAAWRGRRGWFTPAGIPERQEGIVNPPLYRASTILYPTMAAYEGRHERRYTAFAYGIHGTPTTVALAEAAGGALGRRADPPPLVGALGGDAGADRLPPAGTTTC